MLPRIADITPTQTKYLAFLDALRTRGFKGDLEPRLRESCRAGDR